MSQQVSLNELTHRDIDYRKNSEQNNANARPRVSSFRDVQPISQNNLREVEEKIDNFDLTRLVSHKDLFPGKNMLARSLKETSVENLCIFLKEMDRNEYQQLLKESNEIRELRRSMRSFGDIELSHANILKTTAKVAVLLMISVSAFLFVVFVPIQMMSSRSRSPDFLGTTIPSIPIAVSSMLCGLTLLVGYAAKFGLWLSSDGGVERIKKISDDRRFRIRGKIEQIGDHMKNRNVTPEESEQLRSVKASFEATLM